MVSFLKSSEIGSIALRQQIISESGNLAQRFNGLSSNIDAQIKALQEQRTAMATEINGLTENIALLNKKIVETESVKGDSTALRDHRESLIGELSQFAKLRVNETPDGSVSVALANGQPLVAGPTAGQLKVSMTASGEQEVSLAFAGTSFPLRQDGFGGAFGGLYDVEYNSLRPNLDALHDMASQLAQMVNDVLATGFDLNGNPGQPLFVYDPASTTAMLRIEPLTAEQLAFSSVAGETGNNEVLQASHLFHLVGDRDPVVTTGLRVGLWLGAVLIPIQIYAGDMHGLNTLEYQPQKVAAMEAVMADRSAGGGAPDTIR